MWARVDDALLAMQDATEKYAEEHASLTDIPGAAAAIMLCIGANIIIILTAIAALFALAVGFVIVLYALFALACLAVVGPIFRSEGRRVGKGGVRTCRSGGSPYT